MHAGDWYYGEYGEEYFYIRIPNPKPQGKHLRIVLTWDSNPDLNGKQNYLSNLHLVFYWSGDMYETSLSYNDNIEVIDIANNDLTAEDTNSIRIIAFTRIPENARTSYFYWAVGWTWVKDHAD